MQISVWPDIRGCRQRKREKGGKKRKRKLRWDLSERELVKIRAPHIHNENCLRIKYFWKPPSAKDYERLKLWCHRFKAEPPAVFKELCLISKERNILVFTEYPGPAWACFLAKPLLKAVRGSKWLWERAHKQGDSCSDQAMPSGSMLHMSPNIISAPPPSFLDLSPHPAPVVLPRTSLSPAGSAWIAVISP